MTVQAVCEKTTSIPDAGVRYGGAKFCNAALVPTHLVDALSIHHYDYVDVRPAGADDWSDAVAVQAVPLAEDFAYRDDDGTPIVGLRTNVMRTIDDALAPGDAVDVRATDVAQAGPLPVKRSYADEHVGERCYLGEATRAAVGLASWGDAVELVNPETGGRTILPAWPLAEWDDPDQIGLDLHSRELLDVTSGDQLRVREPVADLGGHDRSGPLARVQAALLGTVIGRQEASLNVVSGPHRDEHRNIARVNPDILSVLGMDSGDLATLRWKGREHTVQLLEPPEEMDLDPLSIAVPSTERDQILVSYGDAVVTARDMAYGVRRNLAASLFGVVGVIIGIFKVVGVLALFDRYGPVVGYWPLVGGLTLVSVLASLAVVWVMLYPERQAVTETDGSTR